MPDIEIIAGFAENVVDNGSGVTFSLGTPPIILAIGAFPRRSSMGMGSLVPALIAPREWLAVAVQRNYFYSSGYVLLAFRRLGLRGDAQAVNFKFAAWILAISVLGMVVSFLSDTMRQSLGYAACFLVLGIPCVLRLRSAYEAKKALQAWQAPA